MQPLVIIKLDLTFNTQVNIKCTSWAENIVQDTKLGLGYIKFSVTVNK
jgi:hypothetical protein